MTQAEISAIVRKTAADAGLYRKLFTQGANGVSPAQITMAMKQVLLAAGVQLPEGVTIGLDAAQIILAGGAFAKDLARGASTLQCVGDITTGIAGVTDLLSTLGLLDPQVSDFVSLGSNLALALASGGTNLLADLGVVLSLINVIGDLGNDLFGSQAAAEKQAKANLAKAIQAVVTPEIQAAAKLVTDYTAKRIGVFDLIGGIGAQSPIEFATLFPALATYLPSWVAIPLKGQGVSSGLFSSKTATETATIFQPLIDKKQLQDAVLEEYLIKPMIPFESFKTVAPVISIRAISVLSMLLSTGTKGDVQIGFDSNVVGYLRGLGLTPSQLGDDWLFKGLQRGENDIADWANHLPYPPLTLPYVRPVSSGVESNGIDFLSASQKAQNLTAAQVSALQLKMQSLDQAGDIESLLAIPEAVAMLTAWAKIHVAPVIYTADDYAADLREYQLKKSQIQVELNAAQKAIAGAPINKVTVNGLNKEIAALTPPRTPIGEITNFKLVGKSITTQPWYNPNPDTDPATPSGKQFWAYVHANYALDLSDYWKCLGTLSALRSSNLMADDTDLSGYQGSLDDIEAQFQETYSFFVAKQMNVLARANLAKNLKVPVGTLQSRYDSKNNLIFYSKGA